MPFLQTPTEEELKKQQAGQAPQISGQSTVIGDSNTPTGPQVAGTPKSSGQFTNLQTYLKANEGNMPDQTNKLTGYVDQSANTAQSSAKTYEDNVNANKVDAVDEKELQDTYYNDPGKANKANYDKLKEGYKGPNSASEVAGYNEMQTTGNKAVSDVNALSGDVGQLNQTVFGKNKNYTGGANTLNTMLTQQDPNAQKQIQDTSNKWQGISDLVSGKTNATDTQIKINKTNAASNQVLIPTAETNAVNNLRNPITARAQNLNSQLPTSGNNINPELASVLGIDPTKINNNVDLSSYFTPGAQFNEGNVATAPEQQNWSGLMGLLGGTEQLQAPTDLKQIFNSDKFNTDNAAAQASQTDFAGEKSALPTQPVLKRPKGVSEVDWQNYLASLQPATQNTQPTSNGMY